MTPADLARALVAAPWWEWRAGMLGEDPDGERWRVASEHNTVVRERGTIVRYAGCILPRLRLVLDDPTGVTAGVLVGMLAATGRLVCILTAIDGRPWLVRAEMPDATTSFTGTTLGEAAGRALLAVKS